MRVIASLRRTTVGDLRCAYCHGPALGARRCPTCRTVLHADCAAQVHGCVTLGCVRRADPVRPWQPRPERWRSLHDALATGIEVAITIAALFAPFVVIATLWWMLTGGVH